MVSLNLVWLCQVDLVSSLQEFSRTDCLVKRLSLSRTMETNRSSSSPQDRQWVYRDDDVIDPQVQDHDFKLMTYNILADMFTDTGYDYFPRDLMPMLAFRHSKIIEEIIAVDPDIICLQEVSETHFEKALKPDLLQIGYEGQRMQHKLKGSGDGLAIFYRLDTIRLLDSKNCPSQDTVHRALQTSKLGKHERKSIQKLAERLQGALIAKMEHLASGRIITVGNMHTKWSDFKLPATACLETSLALREVVDMAEGEAYILTGDFNSPPDTPTYSMLSTGRCDWSEKQWTTSPQFKLYEWSGDVRRDPALIPAVNSSDLFKTHPGSARITPHQVAVDRLISESLSYIIQTCSPLHSAYMDIMEQEPAVTNLEASSWPGYIHELCLDYIWYTKQHMVAKSVLETPSVAQTRSHHGLPSEVYPSDHISLSATFQFI